MTTLQLLAAGSIVVALGVRAPPQPTWIHVIVHDARGMPVPALERGDFELLADGRATAIDGFQARPSVAVSLLIDLSYSVSRVAVAEDTRFDRTISGLAAHLRASDRVRVGRVTNRTVLGSWTVDDKSDLLNQWRLVARFSPTERFGPSPLWDAIGTSMTSMPAAPMSEASIVILWTDGRPTGNLIGVEDVTEMAETRWVFVYVIVDETGRQAEIDRQRFPRMERPCALFEALTAATGGECHINRLARNGRQPPLGSLADVTRNLAGLYSLGFTDAGAGRQPPRLDVRVKKPGLTIRGRRR